jgi:hypothetical protein
VSIVTLTTINSEVPPNDDPWLRLHYHVNGERVDCMVRLVTTLPNYGGRRWWFLCPLVGRRAASCTCHLAAGSSAVARPTG